MSNPFLNPKQNIDKNNAPKKTINSFFKFKEEKEIPYESMQNCIQEYLKKNSFRYTQSILQLAGKNIF